MKRAIVTSSLFLVAVISVGGCRSGGGDLSQAETQRRFGVRMAKMDLWREARFRFRRATEIDPSSAMAHNNLAVALEATGDYDAALLEYREALRLDRSNEYIQKNYSRFVEFSQRSKKRERETPPPATVTGTAGVTAAPPETPAAEPADATTPAAAAPETAGEPATTPAPTPTAAQPAVTPPAEPPPPATSEAPSSPPAEPPAPPASEEPAPPAATTTNPPEER